MRDFIWWLRFTAVMTVLVLLAIYQWDIAGIIIGWMLGWHLMGAVERVLEKNNDNIAGT